MRFASKVAYTIFLASTVILVGTSSAQAQKPKKAVPAKPTAKPPVQNQTKTQGQLAGGNGQFGVIYGIPSFNFVILGARYTLDLYDAYGGIINDADSKIVVLDIALKNTEKSDSFFSPDGLITLVDQKGEIIQGGTLRLMSKIVDSASFTLRPGQGLGRPELKDAVQLAWKVPLKSRIVKIMVNKGRVGRKEEVFRYYVAGATKEDAGEAGDPKNVIQPLPEIARDPADKAGAVGAPVGKGSFGVWLPSGYFQIRADGFAYSMENPVNDEPVEDGKRYAILTLTAKSDWSKDISMFEVIGGDFPTYEITDGDGERYKPVSYRKAKRKEDPEHAFKKGDEYTLRVVFLMPKDAVAKKLVIGTGSAYKWGPDVSGIK